MGFMNFIKNVGDNVKRTFTKATDGIKNTFSKNNIDTFLRKGANTIGTIGNISGQLAPILYQLPKIGGVAGSLAEGLGKNSHLITSGLNNIRDAHNNINSFSFEKNMPNAVNNMKNVISNAKEIKFNLQADVPKMQEHFHNLFH